MYLKDITTMMSLYWSNYKTFVSASTHTDHSLASEHVVYWKEKLFTNFITYLLPFCLVAIVPGIWISIVEGYYIFACFGVFTAVATGMIVLKKSWNLLMRKIIVFLMIYGLSLILMLYLGLFGLGMVYLLALSVLVALLLPKNLAYWAIAMNLVVCIGCVTLRTLNLLETRVASPYNVGIWIAFIANLIFLCLVITALINKMISHMEKAMTTRFKLKYLLRQETAKGTLNDELIKESEANYKRLFFLSPLPMIVLDPDTLKFLQVNEAAMLEYGYDTDEFLTMNFSDIKVEEDMTPPERHFIPDLNIGQPLKVITRHRRRNGETFRVEVRSDIIIFGGKQASLLIIRDITKEVNYLEAIEAQNQQLREIAWTQSHSVRKPLANILSLTALISAKPTELPDTQLLTYLSASANELDRSIKSIIENARSVH
ncbi:PAS domain S-box protein [Pedobacter sp. FW305-3-2-15-E-R2A2]|uniref:PAS domain-containing protein n=1 Tax=Pedobacter sp. FW305-3-2-15-E-R2A2 TaxID=3140251 RepID=UPI0031406E0F